jgi:DNA replication protein DnaC
MTITVDTAKLPTLLTALRLPTIARLWPDFCARADKEGWPAARLLAALAELELAEPEQRRIQRHLAEARLPPGKTLDVFDFSLVPSLGKARIMALAEGDAWLSGGHNLLRSARQVPANPTLRQALATNSSAADTACSSPAPPISCSACRPPDRP